MIKFKLFVVFAFYYKSELRMRYLLIARKLNHILKS